jgi:hypothetical protein
MAEIGNATRAEWANYALSSFREVSGGHGNSEEENARDLVSDVFHYLRIDCGLSPEEARGQVEMALRMAESEAEEDSDDE